MLIQYQVLSWNPYKILNTHLFLLYSHSVFYIPCSLNSFIGNIWCLDDVRSSALGACFTVQSDLLAIVLLNLCFSKLFCHFSSQLTVLSSVVVYFVSKIWINFKRKQKGNHKNECLEEGLQILLFHSPLRIGWLVCLNFILEKLFLKLLFSFFALVLNRSYFIDATSMFCAHPKHS